MNRDELCKIMPHRDGMLLLDSATRVADTAHGTYCVRGDEWFLQGHFPGQPIVPGVILCEILAQSTCVLLGEEGTKGKLSLLTGMDKVRLKEPVRPGDVIETECKIARSKPPFYFAEGKAFVRGVLCARADFSFAVMGE